MHEDFELNLNHTFSGFHGMETRNPSLLDFCRTHPYKLSSAAPFSLLLFSGKLERGGSEEGEEGAGVHEDFEFLASTVDRGRNRFLGMRP